jgi:hypothetical protein
MKDSLISTLTLLLNISHFSLGTSAYNAHYILTFFWQTKAIYETDDLEFQCNRLNILKSLSAASCVKYKGHKKSFVQADWDEWQRWKQRFNIWQ